MLKAYLRGKRRGLHAEEEQSIGLADRDLSGLEDPLTAAIFARLTYLDPVDSWALLRGACSGPENEPIPDAPPPGPMTAEFWPRLAPGGASTKSWVEPDVLLIWDDSVFIVEAKHISDHQKESQWLEEILAIRAEPRFAGMSIHLIAAGGVYLEDFRKTVMGARRKLGASAPRFWSLPWRRLRVVAEDRLRASTSARDNAILTDMVYALEAWGYRHRLSFDSLPAATRALQINMPLDVLLTWRTRR